MQQLNDLLANDLVAVNDIILTELIPNLKLQDKKQVVRSLYNMDLIPLKVDWKGIRLLQFDNIKQGINKVGIPDLILVQQAIQQDLEIWTIDKHFQLMQKHFDFKLYKPTT